MATRIPPSHGHPWRIYVVIFIVALIIRLGYTVVTHFPVPFGDESDYRLCANALATGLPYPVECSTPVMRPPLLPMVMAAIQKLGGGNPALAVFQSICGAWAAVMMAASAGKLAGPSQQCAPWIAGLIFSGHPMMIAFTGSVQTEPLFLACCLTACWLTARATTNQHQQTMGLLAGLTWAAACLTRSTALITVGAVLTGLLWTKHLRPVLYIATGLIIGFMPWSSYTYDTLGEALLVDNGLGWATWIGNHPGLLPLYEQPIHSPEDVAQISNAPVINDTQRVKAELIRTAQYNQLRPQERSRLWLKLAKERFLKDPALGWRSLKGKFLVFWRPWVLPGAYSLSAVIMSALVYIGTWSLAILGFIALQQTPQGPWLWLRWSIPILILGQTAAHTLVHAQGRYRLSTVEPWLLLLATYGALHLIERYRATS